MSLKNRNPNELRLTQFRLMQLRNYMLTLSWPIIAKHMVSMHAVAFSSITSHHVEVRLRVLHTIISNHENGMVQEWTSLPEK